MATSYTNIWYDRILKNVRNFLRTEFGNAISVYIGGYKAAGNECIRLVPIESDLIQQSVNSDLREYTIGVYYYYSLKNIQQNAFTEHILARVSRVEAVFNSNVTKNAGGINHYFEGAIQGCLLDARVMDEPSDYLGYIVRWEWTCKHLGNIS